jgi:hypothetical protein
MPTNRSSNACSRSPKFMPLLAAIGLGLGLTGCSSVKNHIDHGPIKARTFSFLNPGDRQLPSYAEAGKQAHALIQQAVIHNLAERGVKYVATGGDVTVAYLIIVGNNVSTTSLDQYFGYSDDSSALVDKVHQEQTGSKNDNRNHFEAGTLVIDLLDPKTTKLLQRRTIQAQVLRTLPLESRTARAQSIVDQALKDLPISP